MIKQKLDAKKIQSFLLKKVLLIMSIINLNDYLDNVIN